MGNLLPFALAYPQAHIVGVELSSVQVNQGLEVVQALGVQNLHLHAMSLTDITPEFRQFDSIIAHGVFSWVPPEVREAMLLHSHSAQGEDAKPTAGFHSAAIRTAPFTPAIPPFWRNGPASLAITHKSEIGWHRIAYPPTWSALATSQYFRAGDRESELNSRP